MPSSPDPTSRPPVDLSRVTERTRRQLYDAVADVLTRGRLQRQISLRHAGVFNPKLGIANHAVQGKEVVVKGVQCLDLPVYRGGGMNCILGTESWIGPNQCSRLFCDKAG